MLYQKFNAIFVVRSVGERTEQLCIDLIAGQGVPESQIYIVNKSPFSEALLSSLRIGLESHKDWTFCVDADVLLRSGSCMSMLEVASSLPSNFFGLQGYVLDKFYGGVRSGGVHIYRSSLLELALSLNVISGSVIRPETELISQMKSRGYPWKSTKLINGIHDFEQASSDIFRKAFIHAHKHLDCLNLFIPYWKRMANEHGDIDFKIALEGFCSGLLYSESVAIDSTAPFLQSNIFGKNIPAKDNLLRCNHSPSSIDEFIENRQDPPEFSYMFGVSTKRFDRIRAYPLVLRRFAARLYLFNSGRLFALLSKFLARF